MKLSQPEHNYGKDKTEQNSEKDQRKMIQRKLTYLILELIKTVF